MVWLSEMPPTLSSPSSLTSFSDEQLNNGIGQPQSGIPDPLHPIRHRINQTSTLCKYQQTAGAKGLNLEGLGTAARCQIIHNRSVAGFLHGKGKYRRFSVPQIPCRNR